MNRQSASTWFHPASATSAIAAGMSASPIGELPMVSVGTVANLETGGLAEARHVARHPVGYPVQHLLQRHLRIAEHPECLTGIVQPSRLRLFAHKRRRTAKSLAKSLRQPSYRQ